MFNQDIYIIDVAPLCFIPMSQAPVASYTIAKEVKRGSLVEVKYGKQEVEAVVLRSTSIKNNKLILKKINDFELKSAIGQKSEKVIFSNEQIELAMHLSNISYSPLGLCLKSLLIESEHYNVSDININRVAQSQEYIEMRSDLCHLDLLYSKIESYLSKSQNVLLISPDVYGAKLYASRFEGLKPIKYISKTKRSLKEVFKNRSGKLFIGTRQLAVLPFSDIGCFIIFDRLNQSYNSIGKPVYNTIDLINFRANIFKSDIIFCDVVPPLNGHTNIDNTNPSETPHIEIIDMVEELKKRNFNPLSKSALDLLENTVRDHKSLLFLAPRRGYATAIGCNVCGKILKCPNCNHFLKISVYPREVIRCYKCLEEFPVNRCPLCNSNESLSPIGNGVEKVYEFVEWRIKDKESDASEIICKIIDKDDSIPAKPDNGSLILVSTQHIASDYLLTKFDFTVIIDAELLVSQPIYDNTEKALRIINLLKIMTKERMLVQLYNKDATSISEILRSDIGDVAIRESDVRNMLQLPPFADLIEVYFESNSKDQAKYLCYRDFKAIEHAVKDLGPSLSIDPPHISYESLSNKKYSYKFNIRGNWPDIRERNHILYSLNKIAQVKIKPKWK